MKLMTIAAGLIIFCCTSSAEGRNGHAYHKSVIQLHVTIYYLYIFYLFFQNAILSLVVAKNVLRLSRKG